MDTSIGCGTTIKIGHGAFCSFHFLFSTICIIQHTTTKLQINLVNTKLIAPSQPSHRPYYALFVSLCCKSFVPYCNHHMMFISRSKLSHFYVSCEFQCSATWSSKDFGGSNSMGFCLILASPCRKHEVFLHIVKTLVDFSHCKHKNLHLSNFPNYAQF